MDTRLVVLNRLLETLAVPVDMTSIDARKKMQKAVYLAQASGLKLGYAPQWFELLSSVHFLRKVRGLPTPDANAVLLKEKPEVAPFADRAAEALGAAQLL